MNTSGRQAHWQNIYTTKADTDVSWFEGSPAISLALIHAAGTPPDAAVIDIGGGAARLVDALLAQSFADVTVLDLSAGALAVAQARLGMQAERVDWVVADVTRWEPARQYDLWHDRAACHFMVEPDDQRAYVRTLSRALRRGGVGRLAQIAHGRKRGADIHHPGRSDCDHRRADPRPPHPPSQRAGGAILRQHRQQRVHQGHSSVLFSARARHRHRCAR